MSCMEKAKLVFAPQCVHTGWQVSLREKLTSPQFLFKVNFAQLVEGKKILKSQQEVAVIKQTEPR